MKWSSMKPHTRPQQVVKRLVTKSRRYDTHTINSESLLDAAEPVRSRQIGASPTIRHWPGQAIKMPRS
nr:MAG TPA: hypothetical protein [Myoviridae sp. ctPkE24]